MNTFNSNSMVTVIVPSYNHEKYITQCIESIINQTYKNFELVVIDDGSTDRSPVILRQLQSKYNFTLEIQENIGVRATLNKALQKYVKGKYVTYCSSDDYFTPKRLEMQVAFMEQHPEFPMSYGKTYVVNEDGEINNRNTVATNFNLKGGDIFRDLLVLSFNPPVTYMFQSSIFSRVGYYKEEIWTEDYYMCLKIAKNYPIGFINEYLYYYREVDKIGKALSMKAINSVLLCINEYKDSAYYSKAIRNWHFSFFRFYASSRKLKKNVLISFIKSLRYFYKPSFWYAFGKLVLLWK